MRRHEIFETLVETVVNGNKIKGNETYMNMIKRIQVDDIKRYAHVLNLKWDINDIGRNQKIDMITSIAKNINSK